MQRHIGIIDMGSNSIRLNIMTIYANGAYNLTFQMKDIARLGQGLGTPPRLHADAMQHAIATVKLFKKMCDANGVTETIPVATAAVRMAVNGPELLTAIREKTGLSFRLLTGDEEARYGYIGAVNTLAYNDAVLVDIGGASTELSLIQQRQLVSSHSISLGAVNLTEWANSGNKFTSTTFHALQNTLSSRLQTVPWLQNCGHLPLIGLGGTMRTLAKIDRRRRHYSLDMLHNYEVTTAAFATIMRSLFNTSAAQRRKMPGLRERADIFPAGLSIVDAILRHTACNRIVVSGNGLRDGLFFAHLFQDRRSPLVPDVLDESINNLTRFYKLRPAHAQHVTSLSQQLFDQLQPLHTYGTYERRLLTIAARLHDLGITINYYDRRKHTFYLIANSRINGLTHREILLCAFIAAGDGGAAIKRWQQRFSDILSKQDFVMAKRLSVLLAIAESMDLTETGTVRKVSCHIGTTAVIITPHSTNGPAEAEVCNARQHKAYFGKAYGKELQFALI